MPNFCSTAWVQLRWLVDTVLLSVKQCDRYCCDDLNCFYQYHCPPVMMDADSSYYADGHDEKIDD